jgi:hypothetical protein
VDQDVAKTDSELLYSFSSLPATVSVVDSLHYSLFEDDRELVIDSEQTDSNIGTILLFLEDSDGEEASPIEYSSLPVYVRDLTNEFYPDAKPFGDREKYYTINLNAEGKLELCVEALSPEGGNISYVFGRIAHTADEGTGVKETGSHGIVAKQKFIPTTDVFNVPFNEVTSSSTFNTEKLFFVQNSAGSYSIVNENDARAIVAAATEEHPAEFFEKVAYIEAVQPGHYYAIADNKAAGLKVNSAYSSRFYIP